ncbi:MAG TPA: CehA/McbA family metallohydrolase [Lacipirellulaceae bacterium]|nr:CehA/McbA family metallohydrolase [Lacipirellulaceae bacterium]
MSKRVVDSNRILIAILIGLIGSVGLAAPHSDGELRIEVVDQATGQPIAARMHLKTMAGRPVKLRLPHTAEFGGHFYINGKISLPLHIGRYRFELEAGPEYLTESGHFEIERHADDSKRIAMKRVVNVANEGWFGGDLDVRRRAADMPLVMQAEGLKVAPLNTSAPKETPPLLDVEGHTIARTPYAWDLPVWLASGKLEGIELINHHSLRGGVVDNENDGRPRNKSFFPGAHGNGRWAETVYYHVLNCGLRIPPVAGSGSGSNDSPVGTNRVYVYCGGEFSKDAWWEGLQAGRTFVTNGPLLRPMVEGRMPGHVFHLDAGQSLDLEIGLNLATSVPVDYLQIIKNGAVASEVRLAEWKNRKGRLPPLHFDDSGWFLVRAVTNNPRVYQFASTGPYYVQKGNRPRISRASVKFFLDWIDADEKRIRSDSRLDETHRHSLLAEQESARRFFAKLLASAGAD